MAAGDLAVTGHKTESVYRRYAIVDSAMHVEPAAKLTAYAVAEKTRAKARQGQLRRFQKRQAS